MLNQGGVRSRSLVDAVLGIEDSTRRLTVCDRSGERAEPWACVGQRARALAAELQARGVEPRDRVLLVGDTGVGFVTAIAAVLLCGAAVCVATVGAGRRRASAAAQARARVDRIGARAVIVDGSSGSLDAGANEVPAWTVEELLTAAARRSEGDYEPVAVRPEDIAVLQFTSGSTGDARVVRISHGNITAYFAALDRINGFDPDHETLVSWLPLSHDMGLIGYLIGALVTGSELLLASPELFVARPVLWLSWISRFDRVQSAGPNFAYALLARSPVDPSDFDLSRWRLAFNGGEYINPTDLERFCDLAASAGFRREAMACSYGLAEATLAVTAALDGGPRCDVVDRDALGLRGLATPAGDGDGGREAIVRLGPPLPCVRLRIVDRATGEELPERHVGEIQVAGDTVTAGYLGDAGECGELFEGEWLRTGDRGYRADGELVVCGRWKDVIVVAGRNLAPQQVEQVAERHGRLTPGTVAAIGVPSRRGTERLVLVASMPPRLRSDALAQGLRHAVHEELGVAPAEVLFVAPGLIPRTGSGKLRRQACRRLYLEGGLC